MIAITTREEYNYCVQRGFNPLLDYSVFKMDVALRVDLQNELFGHSALGRGDIVAANNRFFRWIWDNKPRICEETMRPLGSEFAAVYCSHIMTRGAFPEMAIDPRNINLLTPESHNKWEFGDRTKMRIYPKNKKIIDLLISEYNEL